MQKTAIAAQNTVIQNQSQTIASLEEALAQKPESDTVTFKAYTVAAGDTLFQICAANGLDYNAYRQIILAVNGIADANQIQVGQTILLPYIE